MSKKNERFFTSRRRRIFYRFALILLSAYVFTFFLQWRYYENDLSRTLDLWGNRHAVYLWNVLIMLFIEMMITVFFKRIFLGLGTVFSLIIAVAYINQMKQASRGQPVLPEDVTMLGETGTLTKFVDFGSLSRNLLAIAITIALAFLLSYLFDKLFKIPERKGEIKWDKFWGKKARGVRAAFFIIGLGGFIASTDFIRNNSGERKEWIDFLGTELVAWNQNTNFDKNGFFIGFLYNVSKLKMTEPDGYSKNKMAEIKSKYSDSVDSDKTASSERKTSGDDKKSADSEDKNANLNGDTSNSDKNTANANGGAEEAKKSDDPSENKVNFVVILDESFYDPDIISKYYPYKAVGVGEKNGMDVPITEDVIPTIHSMMKNDGKSSKFATGQMYSPEYGGGTANIEFEIDTSMSNYYVAAIPFVNILPKVKSVPSVASTFKERGYKTFAIHPFNMGMYRRNVVLPKLGYDTLISQDEMDFKDYDDRREYINDRSAYDQALEELKDTDAPAMISVITMQNHTGYNTEYNSYHYLADDADIEDDQKNVVKTYLETLHNSDYYLGEFLNKLDKSDEKTIVLFFGDHSPGIFDNVRDAEDLNTKTLAHVTPYFVWSNFGNVDAKKVFEKMNYGKNSAGNESNEKDSDEKKNGKTEDKGATENNEVLDGQKVTRYGVKGTTLPTTTPNCLVRTAFKATGIKMPDYMELVDDVCLERPILAESLDSSENLDEKAREEDAAANGEKNDSGDKTADGKDVDSEILKEYDMYIYDILDGKRYWLK